MELDGNDKYYSSIFHANVTNRYGYITRAGEKGTIINVVHYGNAHTAQQYKYEYMKLEHEYTRLEHEIF